MAATSCYFRHEIYVDKGGPTVVTVVIGGDVIWSLP
jgi:hypothetical protein